MRRLLPDPTDPVEPAAAYADLRRRRSAHPWVLVNMVASVDGATALAGVSGGLGGPGDKAVFSALRSLADVVLVGASTARAEHYGPPRRADQRIAVVTRSADLDWSWDLFTSGRGVVVAPEDGPAVPVPAVRAGVGDVDLRGAVRALGAQVVLAEGGPTLNAQLLAADLVDELCLTVAPVAVAGDSRRLASGVASLVRNLTLAHVLEHEGELFLRYLR